MLVIRNTLDWRSYLALVIDSKCKQDTGSLYRIESTYGHHFPLLALNMYDKDDEWLKELQLY
jgi:hypothetical protein